MDFRYHYDKNEYKFEEGFVHLVSIKKWFKEKGDFVRKGDLLFSLGYDTSIGSEEKFHYAEQNGYLDNEGLQTEKLKQNELIYIINESDESRINRCFVNTPIIKVDDFTGSKIIKWKTVASNHSNFGIEFNYISFTFNNIGGKDFIVFIFCSHEHYDINSKDYIVNIGDIITFLFDDRSTISFDFSFDAVKLKKGYYENRVRITEEELLQFSEKSFFRLKITYNKTGREIIEGDFSNNNRTAIDLTIKIKKFAKEYRELVRKEIPNYQPFTVEEKLSIQGGTGADEECYVYLMIDKNNNSHKIGISNKPEWREKTLQSEKPVIELIASKKFINRKIASSFEKALHEAYSDKRIRGEWFQLDPIEVEEIKITLNN